MAKKHYADEGFDLMGFVEDLALFFVWMVFGVVVGWLLSWFAHGAWMVSPYADIYGIAGAGIAVLWVSFRRTRHLEHLPHVRKHLEKMAK